MWLGFNFLVYECNTNASVAKTRTFARYAVCNKINYDLRNTSSAGVVHQLARPMHIQNGEAAKKISGSIFFPQNCVGDEIFVGDGSFI